MLRDEWKFQRYAVVLTLLVWMMTAACDNLIDDLNPFSSTPQPIFITPENTVVSLGGSLTFTATNAKVPVSWTVNNTLLATINISTGVLTAGAVVGAVTVTVTDAIGETAATTVSITNTAAPQPNVTTPALFITPGSTQVVPGGTLTFTATNATAPVSWAVSNTTLANINLGTGAFTAGTLPGTVTVTVTDANGATATARVTITTATILVTPSALTLNAIPGTAPDFNVVGNVGTTVFTLGGFTGGYTATTIDSNTGVVTITTLPTLAQGNQTLTITASDGIATSGTATLTLIAQ